VEVSVREGEAASNAVLAFDIRADMWAQPIPIQLYLQTKVNVATGRLTVERTG
jgi:type VI secretion system protein ImpF